MSLKEALVNPEKVSLRKLEHKRKVWDAIKTHHPEHAAFIEMVSEKMGKPERVIVKSNDGTVLDSEEKQ